MKTFLQEIAESIHSKHRNLQEVTVIFPNRRAALYFRHHLSQLLTRPTFAPVISTIEDFIASQSPLKVPETLDLVHALHQAYGRVMNHREPFDEFYFWGEMLLRDFDEIDKYLIPAKQLFVDLSHQKEIDSLYDFLTPEQLTFLKNFWHNFDENLTTNKQKFLQVWRLLSNLYDTFRNDLLKKGLAYEGMLHRSVAETFDVTTLPNRTYIFAGFNALTKTEEKIITSCIQHRNAEIYWDTDTYYLNNNNQEAGHFFRQYQQHAILRDSFSGTPSNFSLPKNVVRYGASQPISQAKLLVQVMIEAINNGLKLEETVIVLPDEKLLIPILHGVATITSKLNVTMGFGLSNTPLCNLIELLLELHLHARQGEFHNRQALQVLSHPYIITHDTALANNKRKEINKQNKIHLTPSWLQEGSDLFRLIFVSIEADVENPQLALLQYLRTIVTALGESDKLTELDHEFCYHVAIMLNRLEVVLAEEFKDDQATTRSAWRSRIKSFQRLFRQITRSQKIPFTGEPLRGLQIMGVLETRNLDFKNVFMISLNEGSFPPAGGKGSYIPHGIRKAYGLPIYEHQDAMYAYLFYRSLQRAEHIHLFYNTETDVLGQGEKSRFLQQLEYESRWEMKNYVLNNSISPRKISPISVEKDDRIFTKLRQYFAGHPSGKSLYATAIIDYLECRLRFYFKYIAQIREANEVEDEMDARILGNFVHLVMQKFYETLIAKNNSHLIEAKKIDEHRVNLKGFVDDVFREMYHIEEGKDVVYEGQQIVVREITIQFADRILELDMGYAPFTIEGIERRGFRYTVPLPSNKKVVLHGVIDRIDKKDGTIRVIDYKTGQDTVSISGGINSLFSRSKNFNKAAFQTLFYALLFKTNNRIDSNLTAGLFNRTTLFSEGSFGLEINKSKIRDVQQLLPEFEQHLQDTIQELYDPRTIFDQTENIDNCKYCLYNTICYR